MTLTKTQAIHQLDRDHFTYSGASALVDYLEQLEVDTGEEMEFDPIAFRCQFTEYKTALEAYIDHYGDYPESLTEMEALDDLEASTTVIRFDSGIIIDSDF